MVINTRKLLEKITAHLRTAGTIYKGGSATPDGEVTSLASSTWKAIGYFSVPPGTVLIGYSVRFSSNTTGRRMIRLTTNNSGDDTGAVANMATDVRAPVNGSYTICQFQMPITTANGATYYVKAWQNSGSTLTLSSRYYVVRLR